MVTFGYLIFETVCVHDSPRGVMFTLEIAVEVTILSKKLIADIYNVERAADRDACSVPHAVTMFLAGFLWPSLYIGMLHSRGIKYRADILAYYTQGVKEPHFQHISFQHESVDLSGQYLSYGSSVTVGGGTSERRPRSARTGVSGVPRPATARSQNRR